MEEEKIKEVVEKLGNEKSSSTEAVLPKLQRKATKYKLSLKKKIFTKVYLENNGHITKACAAAKIDRTTYYRWMKEDKEFNEEVRASFETFNDDIQDSILTLAKDSLDRDLLKFWAKNQMKHRGFSEKTEIEISGNIKANLSSEQMEEHIKRLMAD